MRNFLWCYYRWYITSLVIWAWPKSRWLVLTQSCNRHAIRANVNKASKKEKRGECLPCERPVQGKRHAGKKALLARYLNPTFTISNINLNVQCLYLIWIWKIEVRRWNLLKIFVLLTAFRRNKTLSDVKLFWGRERKEMLRKNIVPCSLERLNERWQIHLGINERT